MTTGDEGTGGTRAVVVGVDGSDGSRKALRWAAAEAAVRQAPLVLVHAWQAPVDYAPLGVDEYPFDPQPIHDAVRHLLETLVAEARELAPDVEVRGELVLGTPAHGLLEAARTADLLVVGSRGLGGFRSMLLGSVSQKIVHHAPCPVVVVPEEEHRGPQEQA